MFLCRGEGRREGGNWYRLLITKTGAVKDKEKWFFVKLTEKRFVVLPSLHPLRVG